MVISHLQLIPIHVLDIREFVNRTCHKLIPAWTDWHSANRPTVSDLDILLPFEHEINDMQIDDIVCASRHYLFEIRTHVDRSDTPGVCVNCIDHLIVCQIIENYCTIDAA